MEEALPRLFDALSSSRSAVLVAPPGAGKTTRVPLALLDAGWMVDGKLLMLEPRRLAARRASEYMAALLGEPVGATVGYRIRGESHVSPNTRIEVLTEGILTRMLQDDPSLDGVRLLVFDEFHERSIHADLGLALALDVQTNLRPDLRILVMSATLDGQAVSDLLAGAPVVDSPGRTYPVETRYLSSPPDVPAEDSIADLLPRILRGHKGHVLVFLPGWREIHRLEALLLQRTLPPDTVVRVLHGDTPPEMQREALAAAAPGVRKIILSTNVAETSLTIDGVRVVVDAGLARVPRFDPRRGMTGLVTVPVSRASADQRRGRAGRQAPGVCYRLWAERHHEERAPHSQPEMAAADLAPFVLELALWGDPLGHHLRFLDPPPPANLERARNLLKDLGAMDTENNLTSHGRSMATIPLHPRLSHMLLRAIGLGLGGPACDVAALLEERDILTERSDVDLGSRYRALRTGAGADRTIRSRVLAEADRLRSVTRCKQGHTGESALGILLALAYPERIACRREGRDGRLLTAGGTGAVLPERSLLRRERFLALGDVDATGTEARVFLASPLREEDLRKEFAGSIRAEEEAVWDDRTESVVARRVERLGAIVLAERPLPKGDKRIQEAMADGIQRMGLAALPWSEEADSIRTRSEWLRRRELAPREWPDLSDGALLENLHEWLGPHLGGRTRREDLQGLRLAGILRARFTHHQRGELDRLAPASLVAPTGSRITLVYTVDGPPVLAVKLQEMFGQTDTPLVAGGKVSVLVHMLSPAGRPLAVTQDLRSFWTNTYPDVRNQMRGRYPKHPWPEDPLAAVPTRGVRRRRTAGG